ncbi:MCE family protein [Nocardia sp. NBC_01503]|uniref:MCE family protein n=1 Tax=Nocardia sp. NBC_01503 TaxID=2975997 RepID=UPI002E7BF21D|nr:MCE family protein [Nocardia sp. NBC_01503]WTL30178.1 MCE family protein [Nocardia sp. NBC_01503]
MTLLDRGTARAATLAVRGGEWAARRRLTLATLGMVLMLLLGGAYLALDIVRVNPLHRTFSVRVLMPVSGGLLPGNDITFRGSRIGIVRSVDLGDTGVVAVGDIDAGTKISAASKVAVQRLSAAGEQFLDFRPDTDAGPYLAEGAVIDAARVSTPVSIESFLSNTGGLIGGLNPARLTVIVDELDKALAGGPDQLRDVIGGLSQAMAGLTGLLPQTRQLIANLQVIAETTGHAQPDLSTLVHGSGELFTQLTAADQEVRRLLEQGPGQLDTLGGVIAETSDPITNLVTNFVAITRAARLRTPALMALFPALRTGSAAIGVPAHDGAFNTMVDIWPRPTCEYETIPVSPAQVADGRVRLYNYCVTSDPGLQVRGSANAPRPDTPANGAAMPPGVSGDELSVPLPGH